MDGHFDSRSMIDKRNRQEDRMKVFLNRFLNRYLAAVFAMAFVMGLSACSGGGTSPGIKTDINTDLDVQVDIGVNDLQNNQDNPEVNITPEGISDTEGIVDVPGDSEVATTGDISDADGIEVTTDVPGDSEVATTEGISDADGINEGTNDGLVDSEVIANCPGNAGCGCQANDECDSGYCIATASGYACASQCDETNKCPDNKVCSPVDNSNVSICVDPYARLCEPCSADADCQVDFTDTTARCIDDGDAGSFCGQECVVNKDCPDGYKCQSVGAGRGTAVKQCVPLTGTCKCSALAIADQAGTPCANTNVHGTCQGSRLCKDTGLTDCSAAIPAQEVCGNNIDDNCNGITDTDCNQSVSVDVWTFDTAGGLVSLPSTNLEFSVSGYGSRVENQDGLVLSTGIIW